MHPSPTVYWHPLLRKVKPETVTPGLQRLYDLAWKDRDRERLFQREDANNDSGLDGFQYESVISTEGLQPLRMGQRVLITPEYKAALSDAKRWFSGGTAFPTSLSVAGNNDDVEMRLADDKNLREKAPGGEVPWPANPDPHHHIFIVIGTPGVGKSLAGLYIGLLELNYDRQIFVSVLYSCGTSPGEAPYLFSDTPRFLYVLVRGGCFSHPFGRKRSVSNWTGHSSRCVVPCRFKRHVSYTRRHTPRC
ncbi:hypothetical protein K435DRAFT_769902 [Dendrothele bispora CBS 962.96]|uniref:Uncharacterized protein n=1 Tax=Dendrothele bispora (strain CBS 962.96) TaxID=1314807 RepID=A0A4S8KQF9_DENBC|nr:hypothetical protein K435DRAFT_769902 [Dendrothele bispora CBS 962.96]